MERAFKYLFYFLSGIRTRHSTETAFFFKILSDVGIMFIDGEVIRWSIYFCYGVYVANGETESEIMHEIWINVR